MLLRPVAIPEPKHHRSHHAKNAVNEERLAPPIRCSGSQESGEHGGDGTPQPTTHGHRAAGQSAPRPGNPTAHDGVGQWVGPRLEQAATQAQQEEGGEAADHPHQSGAQRPEEQVNRQYHPGTVAVANPAGGDLAQSVGPEERRQQPGVLLLGKLEILPDGTTDDAEADAVKVEHQRHEGGDGDHAVADGGGARGCHGGHPAKAKDGSRQAAGKELVGKMYGI